MKLVVATDVMNGSIHQFFADSLDGIIVRRQIELSEPGKLYIVKLLTEFAGDRQAQEKIDEPLAYRMIDALNASGGEKVRKLKDLGDVSLYVSGYFSESLKRSLIDVDYYAEMGRTAYGHLVKIFDTTAAACFREIYEELTFKFLVLVKMLNELSDRFHASSDRDLLKLYEKWLETRDPALADILREKGLIVAAS